MKQNKIINFSTLYKKYSYLLVFEFLGENTILTSVPSCEELPTLSRLRLLKIRETALSKIPYYSELNCVVPLMTTFAFTTCIGTRNYHRKEMKNVYDISFKSCSSIIRSAFLTRDFYKILHGIGLAMTGGTLLQPTVPNEWHLWVDHIGCHAEWTKKICAITNIHQRNTSSN